jgi:hypothetical protein
MLPKPKSEVIEEILEAARANGTSIIDECVAYCEREGIEVEILASAIRTSKTSIKGDIETAGRKLNMLKKND